MDFLPKAHIAGIAREDRLSDILKAIVETAGTGKAEDGKIFVTPLNEAVRIRTGNADRMPFCVAR